MANLFKKFIQEVEKLTQQEQPEIELQNQHPEIDSENNSVDDEQEFEVEFDPETLHGTHYTEEEFEETVRQLSEEWVAK